jgi:hypothetical protein
MDGVSTAPGTGRGGVHRRGREYTVHGGSGEGGLLCDELSDDSVTLVTIPFIERAHPGAALKDVPLREGGPDFRHVHHHFRLRRSPARVALGALVRMKPLGDDESPGASQIAMGEEHLPLLRRWYVEERAYHDVSETPPSRGVQPEVDGVVRTNRHRFPGGRGEAPGLAIPLDGLVKRGDLKTLLREPDRISPLSGSEFDDVELFGKVYPQIGKPLTVEDVALDGETYPVVDGSSIVKLGRSENIVPERLCHMEKIPMNFTIGKVCVAVRRSATCF